MSWGCTNVCMTQTCGEKNQKIQRIQYTRVNTFSTYHTLLCLPVNRQMNDHNLFLYKGLLNEITFAYCFSIYKFFLASVIGSYLKKKCVTFYFL